MIVFDFIYFSIYSFVPDKAIFGKRDVACTLFSTFTSAFLFGLFIVSTVSRQHKVHRLDKKLV